MEKGLPFECDSVPASGWNVLRDDLHFPLMVLKESALAHNIEAMAAWCSGHGYLLAPHGKTTMCPQVFQRQLRAGAWGITAAHASQFLACVEAGVPRVLIANQLTGRANIHSVAAALARRPEIECWCLVDSVEGVRQLAGHLRQSALGRPLPVLLEWGHAGWRTGVRTVAQGLEVFKAIGVESDALRFAGVEAFEGLAGTAETAQEFLSGIAGLADAVGAADGLLFSIGGSAYLDQIHLALERVKGPWTKVVRSGCYVTHDHGHYQELQAAALARGAAQIPEFRPALELWSYVQSVPDPGRALLTFGKRDCPVDLGLPVVLHLPGAKITALNDQHAYLTFRDDAKVSVGDRVACGISHPCTAFDKWRVIPVVDDAYNVLDLYRTKF